MKPAAKRQSLNQPQRKSVLDRALDRAWKQVEPLFVINTESDYQRARKDLDELVDEIGSDENHPRAVMMDTLATLVHAWEEEHHPIPATAPRKVLAFLMEQHGLKQQDLKEVGTQWLEPRALSQRFCLGSGS
jgi:HTH-type transcriptional regulator/antitoxin HigA